MEPIWQNACWLLGYSYRVAAEIVETGQDSLAKLFDVWRESVGGRRNLLVPDATQLGFAQEYRANTKSKFFWVLVVAAPQ